MTCIHSFAEMEDDNPFDELRSLIYSHGHDHDDFDSGGLIKIFEYMIHIFNIYARILVFLEDYKTAKFRKIKDKYELIDTRIIVVMNNMTHFITIDGNVVHFDVDAFFEKREMLLVDKEKYMGVLRYSPKNFRKIVEEYCGNLISDMIED